MGNEGERLAVQGVVDTEIGTIRQRKPKHPIGHQTALFEHPVGAAQAMDVICKKGFAIIGHEPRRHGRGGSAMQGQNRRQMIFRKTPDTAHGITSA